jgi:hypothetical protein
MVARLPSLCGIWSVVPYFVLVAKAAVDGIGAGFNKTFRIARYCAMLCSYAMAEV